MEEKDRAQKLEEYGMALILFLTLLILLVLQYLRPVASPLVIFLIMPVFFYDWLCFTRLQREERGEGRSLEPQGGKDAAPPQGVASLALPAHCRRGDLPAGELLHQRFHPRQRKTSKKDGAYFHWIQGERIEITKEEYNRLEAANSRLFTGHLMRMSVVPLIYFGGRREVMEEQQ